jgi:hypothetical protein
MTRACCKKRKSRNCLALELGPQFFRGLCCRPLCPCLPTGLYDDDQGCHRLLGISMWRAQSCSRDTKNPWFSDHPRMDVMQKRTTAVALVLVWWGEGGGPCGSCDGSPQPGARLPHLLAWQDIHWTGAWTRLPLARFLRVATPRSCTHAAWQLFIPGSDKSVQSGYCSYGLK